MPAKTFREALIDALDETGLSVAEVARGAGVSAEQLRKLINRAGATTNVEDAKRVADFFGVSLDAFLGDPELRFPVEIAALYSRLPDHLKARFEAFGEELLAAADRPETGSRAAREH